MSGEVWAGNTSCWRKFCRACSAEAQLNHSWKQMNRKNDSHSRRWGSTLLSISKKLSMHLVQCNICCFRGQSRLEQRWPSWEWIKFISRYFMCVEGSLELGVVKMTLSGAWIPPLGPIHQMPGCLDCYTSTKSWNWNLLCGSISSTRWKLEVQSLEWKYISEKKLFQFKILSFQLCEYPIMLMWRKYILATNQKQA